MRRPRGAGAYPSLSQKSLWCGPWDAEPQVDDNIREGGKEDWRIEYGGATTEYMEIEVRQKGIAVEKKRTAGGGASSQIRLLREAFCFPNAEYVKEGALLPAPGQLHQSTTSFLPPRSGGRICSTLLVHISFPPVFSATTAVEAAGRVKVRRQR